jgi:hypothetical protein
MRRPPPSRIAALQKGGQDPNLINLPPGALLALASRRPEAEAALRAVYRPTRGPRRLPDFLAGASPGLMGWMDRRFFR